MSAQKSKRKRSGSPGSPRKVDITALETVINRAQQAPLATASRQPCGYQDPLPSKRRPSRLPRGAVTMRSGEARGNACQRGPPAPAPHSSQLCIAPQELLLLQDAERRPGRRYLHDLDPHSRNGRGPSFSLSPGPNAQCPGGRRQSRGLDALELHGAGRAGRGDRAAGTVDSRAFAEPIA